MTNIAELKARYEAARDAEEAARAAYHAAIIAAAPFQVGDIIRSTKGRLARVTALYVAYGEGRFRAVLQNKDGAFGKREAPVWKGEWEAATLQARAAPAEEGEA